MTRGEFLRTAGSAAVLAAVGDSFAAADGAAAALPDYGALQKEIDEVTPKMFRDFCLTGADGKLPDELANVAALGRLDAALDGVLAEVKATVVTDRPAVWFVYNMGVIVKSPQRCFSIDLMHRKATALAPLLDFALITHNHGDHFTEDFYRAMNGAGKTVISNFKDNYGTKNWAKDGGYTRAAKVFTLGDVEVRTSLTDHNAYLADFTTAFEIRIGDYVIFHSGDCSNVAKLNPTRRPDLWFVHPYCGLKVEAGVQKFSPKRTVMVHLNELGHARDRWRWTWKDGLRAQERAVAAGGEAVVPVWGQRIV